MNNIYIVIPVVDTSVQDFSNLVNELCGNYLAQDHVTTSKDENGEDVEEVKENPYKSLPAPDFSGKIILVSHNPASSLEGSSNVVVEGELNIAKLWNAGIIQAATSGADRIVILNEVSSISPYVFEEAVSEHDEPVVNLSDGGCFIVSPEVRANESYRWWFADVDLFENNVTAVCRKEFIDIVQENSLPIEGELKDIAEADIATRSQ